MALIKHPQMNGSDHLVPIKKIRKVHRVETQRVLNTVQKGGKRRRKSSTRATTMKAAQPSMKRTRRAA